MDSYGMCPWVSQHGSIKYWKLSLVFTHEDPRINDVLGIKHVQKYFAWRRKSVRTEASNEETDAHSATCLKKTKYSEQD